MDSKEQIKVIHRGVKNQCKAFSVQEAKALASIVICNRNGDAFTEPQRHALNRLGFEVDNPFRVYIGFCDWDLWAQKLSTQGEKK